MNAQVNGRAFTRFNHLIVYLLLHLRYHLFNASWVNTSVGNELVKGETANLAAHRVEGTDNDCLRRIVYNNLNARSSLQGTNVTTFTADDAALHFVVVDVKYRYTIFDSRFRSYALNSLNYNAFCFFICSKFCIVHDVVDVALCVAARFIFERVNESLLCLVGRESAEFLQLLTFLEL